MQDSKDQSPAMNRRNMIGATTTGLTLLALGCERPGANGPTGAIPIPNLAKFQDQGHRLYGIVPAKGQYFPADVLLEMKPQPVWITPFSAEAAAGEAKTEFNYVLWALPDDADAFLAQESVKSVIQKQPRHVTEMGIPTAANGTLAVKFFPNAITGQTQGAPHATVNQIVVEWREALSQYSDIVINPGPESEIPKDGFGDMAEAGQIIIQFSSPNLPNNALDTIKRHPQTISLRWGSPFTVCYCPGCGMG